MSAGFGINDDARRRVVVALHDELLNGATISVLRAIPLLVERGWDFSFWAPSPGPASDWLRERGAAVKGAQRPIASGLQALREPPGLRRRLAGTPGYLSAFQSFLRATGPDLVHANSLYSFAEALAARAMRIPTLLHVHDMAPASRKAAIARWICRRGVDLTIAVSEACADSYAASGWRPPVVHEAAPVPEEPVMLRSEPDPFVVGTVGVIARRKGSDLFVEAAELLRGEQFEFRMIGTPSDPLDRDWAAGVIARAKRAGIRYLERAPVEEHMRGWDALALPSRRDPFPIVVLEAMALGLPVVGARRDGIPEQLAGGAGLLIEPEDPVALAEALRSLRAMPASHRRSMGEAARIRVASEFHPERQAAGINEAYETVRFR